MVSVMDEPKTSTEAQHRDDLHHVAAELCASEQIKSEDHDAFKDFDLVASFSRNMFLQMIHDLLFPPPKHSIHLL